jgi:hypothetical protein
MADGKIWLLVILIGCWIVNFPAQLSSSETAVWLSTPASAPATEPPDPTKPGSELNHHLVGYALIAMAIFVIAGKSSAHLRSLETVWPFVFVALGVFLAIWSDGEIWPRGNLSWFWLIHHDAEARQHKIYAILLVAMGMIEFLRARGELNRVWRTWAFSLLALFGIVFLMFHDHAGTGGASSPEARNYWVSWSISGTAIAASAPSAPVSDLMPAHHHSMTENAMQMTGPGSAPVPHEGIAMQNDGHQHVMSPAMAKIAEQHLWFALIGFAVVLFKFIDDGALWQRRFVPFLWPSCVVLLGALLVFYTE